MTEKAQHLHEAGRAWSIGQSRPGDHDDGKAELPGGFDLGDCAGPSGIAGDDPFDLPRAHEITIAFNRKGAARNNDAGVRQRQRGIGRIGQSHSVAVLRSCGERLKMPPANGQEDPGASCGERRDGGCQIIDIDPVVAGRPGPGRALQRDQRRAGHGARRHRISAHLERERMRGVDDMGDPMLADVIGQAARAAKPTDAGRQRLRGGRLGAAGVGIGRVKMKLRDSLRETVGVAGSAQDEGARHD